MSKSSFGAGVPDWRNLCIRVPLPVTQRPVLISQNSAQQACFSASAPSAPCCGSLLRQPSPADRTGIFIGTGDISNYLETAAHVINRATEIEIVTEDGMRHAATVIAVDNQRDTAILKTGLKRWPMALRLTNPAIGEHGCAILNNFGLGLSISCGAVSAIHRKQVGFNPIEDFVQTDAAINPGGSGGALVDANGQLIGMIDGIFTKKANIDSGVNFAVSVPLLIEGI